jgi:ankyrin repeat protein
MKHLLLTTIAAVVLVGCGNPESALRRACADGNIEAVKQAITDGADVNAKNRIGWTPLHNAAFSGHKEIVELLIDAGADVNAKSGDAGVTPLHYAANKEIAELLIAKGAEVNAKSNGGKTPLDYAEKLVVWQSSETKEAAKKEIAALLRKHGGKTGALQSSNNSDKEKALELLFGTNPTITKKDEAFLSAAKEGELDKVKRLLAEGVDIDCSDAFSCTGLFWASANNHKSIVEFLIEKGANLNAGAGIGGTPLARAAYEGHVEVVELLLTKGADVNAKDVSGRSPLDSADESVVDLLRKHGGKTEKELEAEGKSETLTNNVLRVSCGFRGSTYMPFTSWDINAEKPIGYDPDLIKLVAKEIGLNVKFVDAQSLFKRSLESKNQFDARLAVLYENIAGVSLNAVTINNRRNKLVDFSMPYFTDGLALLAKKESKILTLDDLKEKKILTLPNTTGHDWCLKEWFFGEFSG